jgi:hypothetical protein
VWLSASPNKCEELYKGNCLYSKRFSGLQVGRGRRTVFLILICPLFSLFNYYYYKNMGGVRWDGGVGAGFSYNLEFGISSRGQRHGMCKYGWVMK